jgi:hypothetical protein
MVMRARAIVGTVVWGELYVKNFLKYVLPTWLSPGNLPSLFKHMDGEIRIYTREEDLLLFDQIALGERFKSIAPIVPYKIDIGTRPSVNVTHDVYHNCIVADARSRDEAVVYLTPDLLWADGSLGYVGQSLAFNNVMVLVPDYRVVTETIEPEMNKFRTKDGSIIIPTKDAQRLLVQHLSPLTACYHAGGKHVPDHGEIIIWPVGNEGLLFYNLSKDSHFFWPARIRYTSQNLPDLDNDFSKFDIVQDSNIALGLSLTPLGQNLNWLRQGKPFDPVRIAQFLLCFYTAHNGTRIQKPVYVSLTDTPTLSLWDLAGNEALECLMTAMHCANAMAANDQKFMYPPPPSSVSGSLTDIELCCQSLEWLVPVINNRFPQRSLSYLKAIRRKYPGGDLPGYCSSWPTVLPLRP